jgi:hypothetical protein
MLPGGEEAAISFREDRDITTAAGARGRDKEGREPAEAVEPGEVSIEAIGQAPYLLAGVPPRTLYGAFVGLQLVQAFGAVRAKGGCCPGG